MKKTMMLFFTLCFILCCLQYGQAKTTFKFPSRIMYKILQNGNIVGECFLVYKEKTNKDGISSLKLTGFQGMGLASDESFLTYMFTDSSSIYADFLLNGGEAFSEMRLKDKKTFDRKMGKVFVYKEKAKSGDIQTELFTQYPVIDLLSTFFVTSKRVAAGEQQKKENYNLLILKSTKIAEMKHLGTGQEPFQGKAVDVELLAITISDVEMFRMAIYKDNEGYCFPVNVQISEDSRTMELRADRVSK